jgi:hypothetical protein
MDKILRERLQTVSSFETKSLLLSKENALLERVSVSTAAILKGLNSSILDTPKETAPLSFNIKLRNGRPIAVRMDDPAAAYATGA